MSLSHGNASDSLSETYIPARPDVDTSKLPPSHALLFEALRKVWGSAERVLRVMVQTPEKLTSMSDGAWTRFFAPLYSVAEALAWYCEVDAQYLLARSGNALMRDVRRVGATRPASASDKVARIREAARSGYYLRDTMFRAVQMPFGPIRTQEALVDDLGEHGDWLALMVISGAVLKGSSNFARMCWVIRRQRGLNGARFLLQHSAIKFWTRHNAFVTRCTKRTRIRTRTRTQDRTPISTPIGAPISNQARIIISLSPEAPVQ